MGIGLTTLVSAVYVTRGLSDSTSCGEMPYSRVDGTVLKDHTQ